MNNDNIILESDDFFNILPCGLIITNKEYTIVKSNSFFLELVAHDLEEVNDKLKITDFLSIGSKLHFETHFAPMLHMHGYIKEVNIELKNKKQAIIPALINSAPFISKHTGEKYFYFTIFDISQRKLYEKELLDAKKMSEKLLEEVYSKNSELKQVAYAVSHDLKNPIRSIIGFLSLLNSKYASINDDKFREYLKTVINSATRMHQMIVELIDGSTSNKSFEKKPTDFNILIEEVKSDLYKLILDKSASINHENLPILNVNKIDIIRLFENLIGNSIKFMPKDKRPIIDIYSKEEKYDWLFEVKDNGIGIDSINLKNIFEIFTQIDKKEDNDGKGIGLANCKKIIEIHNGKIWVESTLNEGTSFFFTLPKN